MIDDRTLLFASPDGTFLMQPPGSPADDCNKTGMDARLQPWFTGTTRERPVEVVVVLDVLSRPSFVSADLIDDLKQSVVAVLRSLTNQDRVGDVVTMLILQNLQVSTHQVRPVHALGHGNKISGFSDNFLLRVH